MMTMGAHRFDDGPQPQIVVQEEGRDGQHFQVKPSPSSHDNYQGHSKYGAGDKAGGSGVTDVNSGKSQQKGESGDDARLITQGVSHHRSGHDQQEYEIP